MLFDGVSALVTLVSVVLAYFALGFPAAYVELYVAVMLLMGIVGLVRARPVTTVIYRPRRLVVFAVLVEIDKDIGGGGYGPVVTL